jgi:hypothetical protein
VTQRYPIVADPPLVCAVSGLRAGFAAPSTQFAAFCGAAAATDAGKCVRDRLDHREANADLDTLIRCPAHPRS